MNNEKIVDQMIIEVEKIVRDKVKEDFSATPTAQKKAVVNEIVNKLEEIITDENQ